MSKIPAREFFKDEVSTFPLSPSTTYTTIYDKPLKILRVDARGEESVEITHSTYKSINEIPSIEKISEICEKIVNEKMAQREKSLLGELLGFFQGIQDDLMNKLDRKNENLENDLLSRLTDTFVLMVDKVEKNTESKMGHIEQKMEQMPTKEQMNEVLESMEKEIFDNLQPLIEKTVSENIEPLKQLISLIETQAPEEQNDEEPSVKIYDENSLRSEIKDDYLPEEQDPSPESHMDLSGSTSEILKAVANEFIQDINFAVLQLKEDIEKEEQEEKEQAEKVVLDQVEESPVVAEEHVAEEQGVEEQQTINQNEKKEEVVEEVAEKVEDQVADQTQESVEEPVADQTQEQVEEPVINQLEEQVAEPVADQSQEQLAVQEKVEEIVLGEIEIKLEEDVEQVNTPRKTPKSKKPKRKSK
jgi:hypothetical protein